VVLSDGLPEHEPLTGDGQVTLALTLLRCVGGLSHGDLATREGHAGPAFATPGAQCFGKHTFRYGLLPIQRSELPAVSNLAAMFMAPPHVIPCSSGAGLPPATDPILRLSPDFLVLSCLTVSEDGEHLLARFHNPTREAAQATVTFGRPVLGVQQADAAESVSRQLALEGIPQRCRLDLGPAEIVTLLVAR
jgi:alpha-mannosidase